MNENQNPKLQNHLSIQTHIFWNQQIKDKILFEVWKKGGEERVTTFQLKDYKLHKWV